MVHNSGNNNAYDYTFYDCFSVPWKKEEKGILYMGIVLFYPSGKQGGAISQLVKKCNYGQGEVFKDCELGYSFDIGNTDVLTNSSFLCV